ncbi:O-antigen ligase family protein [bacterium]|nr:O-antigen ligase family protein [bacterium]
MIDRLIKNWVPYWPGFLVLVVPFLWTASETFTISFIQIASLLLLILLLQTHYFQYGSEASQRFFQMCLAWLVILGISAILSVDPTTSIPIFVKIIGLALTCGSIRYCLYHERTSAILFMGASISALAHGLFGVFEYFQGLPVPPSWLDPGMAGIIRTRVAGIFGDPNIYGVYLGALIPFIVAGIFIHPNQVAFTIFFSICLFFGGLGLLLSFSRGAYLSAIAGLVILVAIKKPAFNWNSRKKAISAVFMALFLVFLIGPFKYRFLSIVNPKDMTLSQRTLINKGIWNAFPSVPIFGFGLHSFNQVYPRFRVVGGDYPMNAHNEFLQSYFECGLISVIFLIGMCGILFFQLGCWLKGSRERISWENASSASVFITFFVQNMSGFSDRIFPTSILLAVAIGGILNGMKGESPFQKFSAYHRYFKWIGTIFVALFLLFTLKNLYVQVSISEASLAVRFDRFLTAQDILQGVERIQSNNPVIHYQMSGIDEAMGRPASAVVRIERAIALNPTEALFWVKRSRLARKYKFGKANEYFLEAIKLDPASEHFRLEMASILASEGKLTEAMEQLDLALSFSPQFDEVYKAYKEVKKQKEILKFAWEKQMKKEADESIPAWNGISGSPPSER